MSEIVIDIETQNTFREVGFPDPKLLKISVVVIFDYNTGEYRSFMEEELKDLWPILEKCDRIIGYNIRHFDLPVMQQYYSGDIMKFPMLDIIENVKEALGFRLKLDNIAQHTLGMGKSGDGLQAVEFWKAGEIEKLKSYCKDDVKITKEIYEYGKLNGHLKFSDLGTVKQFPVTFPDPSPNSRPAVNLTLSF